MQYFINSFKHNLLIEREIMHPLNRILTYVITPVYLIVSLLLIIAFAVFMEIDENKYFVVGICLLSLFGVISIILVFIVHFLTKRVLRDELEQYDFDFSKFESKSEYCYPFENDMIKFDEYGMYVKGDLHYYNHMQISVITDNYCHRIFIALRFALNDESYYQIKLSAKELKMISDLKINIQNQDTLKFILNNKKSAFKQIYDKGYVSLKNKKYR